MRTILLSLILLTGLSSTAQSYEDWVHVADSLYSAQAYPASSEAYAQAFKIRQRDPGDLYNAACSAALAGDKKTALKWLDAAQKTGWVNHRHASSDADLESVRKGKKWNKILGRMRAELDKKEENYDKELQAELLEIYEADQGIRHAYISSRKELGWDHPTVDSLARVMHHQDSINLGRLTKILDERGWVGPELVGGQASHTQFLVIQHADLEVQEKYFPMVKEAVEKKQLRPSSFALLQDRMALRQGKLQIYGSQLAAHPETKQYYLQPMIDPDRVDERRAEIGLSPLADYLKHFDLEWDLEAYKKQLPYLIELEKDR